MEDELAVRCASCGEEYIAGTVLCPECLSRDLRPLAGTAPLPASTWSPPPKPPTRVRSEREPTPGRALFLGIMGIALGVWPAFFFLGWILGFLAVRDGYRVQQRFDTGGIVAGFAVMTGAASILLGFGAFLRLIQDTN